MNDPFLFPVITMHGLDADHLALHHGDEEENLAKWLYLDRNHQLVIRIGLDVDPGRWNRDAKALRRLAALATQVAMQLEQLQEDHARDVRAGTHNLLRIRSDESIGLPEDIGRLAPP